MANLPPVSTLTLSATDFIKSGLRLVGALRSGQNLSAAELNDCKLVLNSLLDAWSAKSTNIFVITRTTTDQNGATLTLQAAKQTYLLGNLNANEDFLLSRPPRLDRVSVIINANSSTPNEKPMDMYDDVRWQGVPNKNTQSLFPEVCYKETGFPDISLSFWPVPTQASPVVLYMWQGLTQFADLTAQFQFPPAYARAIRFNLAVDLAAEFPCDLQKFQIVSAKADRYLNEVQAQNAIMKESTCDEAIVGADHKMGNIYTGSAHRYHGY